LVNDENNKNIPPLICWGAWLARNKAIYKYMSSTPALITSEIAAIYGLLPTKDTNYIPQIIVDEETNSQLPWTYFDGASNENGVFGGGLILHLNSYQFLKSKIGLNRGTNIFDELLSLQLVLCWALEKDFHSLQVFGDSLNVINLFNTF